jgi:transposase
VEEYHEGILAYYQFRISTGPLEGTNNKIKTMQRQAYGFRDRAFLKLKILGIHESKYALVSSFSENLILWSNRYTPVDVSRC